MPAGTHGSARRTGTHPDGGGLGPEQLAAALAELHESGAVQPERLAALVEEAAVATYRRLVEDDPAVAATVDLVSGRLDLYRLGPDGERVPIDTAIRDFPRQAALAAKAAVASWLRDAERERVAREAATHRGELIDAIVERHQGQAWLLRAGDVEAVLPPEEQMADERLEPHRHLKVVVLDSRRHGRDAQMVVSRSHPGLLRQLLEQEVPELVTGQVVIKAIARDPGRRSKVAVHAPAGDIDPQGACIGPRGVRHRAVVSQLSDEQVQIVGWSADPATFAGNAVAPATALRVDLDEASRTAHITVRREQLSLAIGRAGENARLAARLTGWRIDIHPDGEPEPRGEGA